MIEVILLNWEMVGKIHIWGWQLDFPRTRSVFQRVSILIGFSEGSYLIGFSNRFLRGESSYPSSVFQRKNFLSLVGFSEGENSYPSSVIQRGKFLWTNEICFIFNSSGDNFYSGYDRYIPFSPLFRKWAGAIWGV